jgi:hypothetical protein
MSLVMSMARLQAQRRTVAVAATTSLTKISSTSNMLGAIRSLTLPVDVEHFTSGWNITDMYVLHAV